VKNRISNTWYIFLATVSALCAQTTLALTLNLAVIETEASPQQNYPIQQQFKDELLALLGGQHQVNLIPYTLGASASADEANRVLDDAYANPDVDMVLVLDVAANQSFGLRSSFLKPTFLPLVFNAQLTGYPFSDGASNTENLSYLTREFDFAEELEVLREVTPFTRAVLVTDPRLANSIETDRLQAGIRQASEIGVTLTIDVFEGNPSDLVDSWSADVDSVLLGFFAGYSDAEVVELIDAISARGIPTFSLIGEEFVRLGALATSIPATDWQRLARRNGFNIEDVLLGGDAGELPVFFESSRRLMINMDTSRRLRVAPRFAVLSDAVQINEENADVEITYSLNDVARLAVRENLEFVVQRLRAEIATLDVDEVRSALLPQLSSRASFTTRRDTLATRSGFFAKDTSDGYLTLSQSLFSEKLWSSLTIQKYLNLAEQELLREVELDITKIAVDTYLSILVSRTDLEQQRFNLDITRENYRLAENRVQVGSENSADLYRWESELANAKQAVLSANALYEQQRQILNQILNRPIDEEFSTTVETLENPMLLISDRRLIDLIQNIYDIQALAEYFVNLGLERAPEIKQVDAQLAAARRQLKSDERAFWLPEVNLIADYRSNFEENRVMGSGFSGEDDWTVGVEVTLPLYQGGVRSARKSKSALTVQQRYSEKLNAQNLVERDIRNAVQATIASFNSIELAEQSENASLQNYNLVSESYNLGGVSIVTLLDAQEALVAARQNAMNAGYTFLLDLMELQRASGAFDFFLTDPLREELTEDILRRVQDRSNSLNQGVN